MATQEEEQWIQEASTTHGVPVAYIKGLIQQESGFRKDIVSDAGAVGYMQLMPETAQELGVTDSTDGRQNIMGGTQYLKQAIEKNNGSLELALASYNAGQGAVNKYGGIPPFAETQDYVRKVMRNIREGGGETGYFQSGATTTKTNAYGATANPDVPTKMPEPQSFGTFMRDKGLQGFYDNGLAGLARIAFSTENNHGATYTPSEDEFKMVTNALPNRDTWQKWCLVNASSPEQLKRLVAMRQEDANREQRISEYKASWSESVAGFGAGMIGATVGDPMMLVPFVGQEALALKTVERLGISVSAGLSTSKILKYADIAVQQAGLMGASRKFAEEGAGFDQDYTHAMILGGIAGAGIHGLGDLWRKFRIPETARLATAFRNMEDHAVTMGMDMRPPSEIAPLRAEMELAHQPSFLKGNKDKDLQKLVADGKVVIVSKEALRPHAVNFRIDPDNVRGFHLGSEDLTVLVKENLDPNISLSGLMKHELGVHAGLGSATEKEVAYLKASVLDRMNVGDESWLQAMRDSAGGGWEETLGHWVEKNIDTKDPLLNTAKNIVKRFTGGKDAKLLSDADLKDAVKRMFQNEVDKQRGYKVLADGSEVMNGNIKFSANNIVKPSLLDRMIDIEPDNGFFSNLATKYSKWNESGWLYRTPQGVLINCPVKYGREVAKLVLEDARKRGRPDFKHMSLEMQKKWNLGKLNEHSEAFLDLRSQYLGNNKMLETPSAQQDFNRQVIEWHNYKYGNTKDASGNATSYHALPNPEGHYAPEVRQAGEVLNKRFQDIEQMMKTSGTKEGYGVDQNFISPDKKFIDGEFMRRIEPSKWRREVAGTAGGAEQFAKNLTEYYKKFAKREIIRQNIEAEFARVYQTKMDEWQILVDALEEGAKKPRKPPKKKVTDKHVEARVEEIAPKWAKGVGDQNLSNIDRFIEGEKNPLGLSDFMEHRSPLDTSGVMEINGKPFSYDSNLRSFNLDQMLPRANNRITGELALHNLYGTTEALNIARGKIMQGMVAGEQLGGKGITTTDVARQLEAFDTMISDLRGLKRDVTEQGILNAVKTTLMGTSYAKNGSLFGVSQLGEAGNAIGHIGFKAIYHFIPAFANKMRDLRLGKGTAEFAKEMERHTFGASLERRTFGDDMTSQIYLDATSETSLLRRMDKIQTTVNYAGKLVAKLSGLPKLTDMMMRGIRTDTMLDIVEWCGKRQVINETTVKQGRVGLLRNPFSPHKLNAVGLKDPAKLRVFQDAVDKYIPVDANGKRSYLQDQWIKEDPNTYAQFVTLVENQSQRAMVQGTVGNRAMVNRTGFMSQIFFQFKDYTLKTMNSQVARMLTKPELDSALGMMLSMVTNAGVYVGLSTAKSYAYHGSNEAKRQEYMKEAMKPSNIIGAGILRSSLGSVLSFGADAMQATTGTQSFRTTVSSDPTKKTVGQAPHDPVSGTIGQLPALQTLWDLQNAGSSAGGLVFGSNNSQKDVKALYRVLPGSNSLPMVRLAEMTADASKLPEKKRPVMQSNVNKENPVAKKVNEFFNYK